MGWFFVFDGETYRDADITVDQAERIQALTVTATNPAGSDWFQLAPLKDALHAQVVIGLIVADATGKPYDDVKARIRAMTVDAVWDLFVKAEDDLPSEFTDEIPPVADEPSTLT